MKNKYDAISDFKNLFPLSISENLIEKAIDSLVSAVLSELVDAGLLSTCPECYGKGQIIEPDRWHIERKIDCSACSGRGFKK